MGSLMKKDDWVMKPYEIIQELFDDSNEPPTGIVFGILTFIIGLILAIIIVGVFELVLFDTYIKYLGSFSVFNMFYYITWNATWTLIVSPILIFRGLKKGVFKL